MSALQSIQAFISNVVNTKLSTVRIIVMSKWNVQFPKAKEGEECIVLGNGPSLKQTLVEDLEFIKKRKLIAVNFFAFSEAFQNLKPEYYLLNAPEYFSEVAPHATWEGNRNRVFKILNEQTNWPMILFVPMTAAKTSFWKNIIQDNKNISICYYNTTPVEGLTSYSHFYFKRGWGMPRPHNVLVPGVFLALNMGYKKVFITGADHSWHEEIIVDENNLVNVKHEHFYDSKQISPMHKLGGKAFYLHDFFRKMYLSFEAYFILKKYAASLNASIINISKKSYIDAFEKQKV